MNKSILTILALILATPAWSARIPANYQYPITNNYDATVIGTPPAFSAKLPKDLPAKTYSIKSINSIPELFWYNQGLEFSAALQSKKAPLVFNIAGTGASFDSAKMIDVQKALYQAGFHVINISSPTHLDFLLNGSTSRAPGYAPDDARDIYRVMQDAYGIIKDDITVSGFHITGYSLGAMHAAFIADIDSREKKFKLQKVYMINPPVNLYSSAIILDKLTTDNIPSENGATLVGVFLDDVIKKIARDYEPDKGMRIDSDFLFRTYKKNNKNGVFADDTNAAGLIGFSFRLSSGAIVFASDLMNNTGYIVPKNKQFKRNEPLGYYMRASHTVTFQDYVDDMLIPLLQKKYPGSSKDSLIEQSSLKSIETFMASNPNVHVITNRDEIILADGEMAYLESLMKNRITIYPYGGHCGNMSYKDNVADMVAFLKGGKI